MASAEKRQRWAEEERARHARNEAQPQKPTSGGKLFLTIFFGVLLALWVFRNLVAAGF